ncbi:MAG: Uma2 family endonuclease [Vulcanimicrobiaceae bacterium]
MEQPGTRRLTLDEYLALESISTERLEFRDGLVVALALPTKNHARIAGNLTTSLGAMARRNGCDYFVGDAEVQTPAGDRVIPDFVVTCDPRDLDQSGEAGEALVRHPWLVVEILSPATAADDTTYKLDAYQSIVALTHYVAIDSRRRAIRVYAKNDAGRFESDGPVDRLTLPTLAASGLSLDDIYRDTTVPHLDVRAPLLKPE